MKHAHSTPTQTRRNHTRRTRLRAAVAALITTTLAGIGLVAVAPTSHAADINLPPTATITGFTSSLGVAAADGLVYVTDKSSNAVKVYDAPLTAGASPVRTIPIGAGRNPLGVGINNGYVYVANDGNGTTGDGSVSVYAAGGAGTSNDRIRNITGLTRPHDVGFDDQYMYVSCFYNCPTTVGGRMSVISLSTNGTAAPVREFAVPTPVGVVVTGGEIFVATSDNGAVQVYESGSGGSNTAKRTISGGNTQLNRPTGIAVADGHIIVANHNGNSVTAYKTTDTGNTAPQWRLTGSGPTSPHGIDVENNRIYAITWGATNDLVQYPLPYNPTPVRTLSSSLGGPGMVWSVERMGNYLVWSDSSGGKIWRMDVRDGTRVALASISSSGRSITQQGDYVYWTDTTKIGRVKIDGSDANPNFITLPAGTYANGLTSTADYLFWTNWNSTYIGRANIDGTGVNNTFINGTGVSSGAGISANSTHVFWSDMANNRIGRAKLDGSQNMYVLYNTTGPAGIDVVGDTIYWTDNGPTRKANVNDMANTATAIPGLSGNGGITVDGNDLYYYRADSQYIGRATTSGLNSMTLLPFGGWGNGLGMEAPGDGYVYATDSANNKVYVYKAGARASIFPERVISTTNPAGMSVANGLLYVTNTSSSQVSVYLSGGVGTSDAVQRTISLSGQPCDVTVAGDDLYVSSWNGNSIVVYQAGGAGTSNTVKRSISGGSLNSPNGIIVTGGNVYVGNPGDGKVLVYPTALTSNIASRSFGGSLDPTLLALGDFNGQTLLWAASNSKNSINGYKLTSSGTVSPEVILTGTATGLSTPRGVAVDDGVIYTNNQNSGLRAFNSNPRIDAVSPTSGRPGATVTLTGKYFTGATAVRFGGATAAFTVDSDTQITATAPFMAQGKVAVEVQTGAGVTRKAEAFTYTAPALDEDLCANAPQLVNGSFDTDFPAVAWQRIWVDASNVPKGYKHVNTTTYPSIGWRNTAENVIELIESGANSQIADNGGQYAELNANVAGTLYQDVATTPGTTLRWSLSHRARNGDGAAAAQAGTNTMRVMIGVPGGSLVQSGSDLTSPGTSWSRHSGTYTVPAGQTTTRFAFQAVSPSGSMGNLLDNITFSAVGCAAAPTGLVATPGDGSASVAFTAGDNGGDAVTNYAYKVGSGAWTALSPADAASPVTIPDLEPGKSYTIRLRALNSTAAGLASAPVTVKMADPDANVNTWSSLAFSTDGALHVATRDTGKILVFAANASGNAAPVRTITGAATGLANRPHGIAVAADGSIYVSTFDDDTIRVFAPGATGNTAPTRTISGENTGLDGPNGIALADDGTVYVASQIDKSIRVFAPDATGNATPLRTIKGTNTTLGNLRSLALGPGGTLYVTDTRVKVFNQTDNGNTAPTRTVHGTQAGLNSPTGLAVTTDGRIILADRGDDAIRIYAPNTNGNIKPVRIIKGSQTGLTNPTGIALRTLNGTTWIYTATPGNGTIRAWTLN